MIWNAKRSGQSKQNPGTSNRDVSRQNQFAVNRSIARAGNVLARVKRKLVAPRLTKSRARLPSIWINTMPKSGSIYLSRMVTSSLGIEFSLKPLAHGFFPTYFMIPDALERFSGGDVVRQEHFDASPINLTLCGRNIDDAFLDASRQPPSQAASKRHKFHNSPTARRLSRLAL
jgi:hypothetical protein